MGEAPPLSEPLLRAENDTLRAVFPPPLLTPPQIHHTQEPAFLGVTLSEFQGPQLQTAFFLQSLDLR